MVTPIVVRSVLLVVGAVLGLVLLVAPFSRTFRAASGWLRTCIFIGALFVFIWAIFGLSMQFHLSSQLLSFVRYFREPIGGIGIGLVIAAFTSPESRTLSARRNKPSNQPLESTATR